MTVRRIPIPLRPEPWAMLEVDTPMSPEQWEQLMAILQVMRPGLVQEPEAEDAS